MEGINCELVDPRPQASSVLDAARFCLEQGWVPIPVRRATEEPLHWDWRCNRPTEDDLEELFAGDCGIAVINGRTDLRLDIESAELGGLAYRINQLLNVFTGTPEEDEEGRVSSPPEAWSDAGPPTGGGAAAPSAGADEDDPELAAKLAAEPEDAYYTRVYTEYVAAKEAAGENVSNITQDRFVQRLQANEKSLIKKHGCRMVRFQVQVKGTQVNLRPVIIQ